MGKVTMSSVASAAGVSPMTVSLALRDNPSIPETTRTKIKTLAQKLGYRTDPIASSLMSYVRSHRSKTSTPVIAYLNTFPQRNLSRSIPTFNGFFEGAQKQCIETGYKLEEFWLHEQGMTGRRMSQILYSRGIGGILITPRWLKQKHLYLKWEYFTSVVIGDSIYHPPMHRVCNYQYHSVSMLLRNLRRLGYRNIGIALNAEFEKNGDSNYLAAFNVFKQQHLSTLKCMTYLPTKWEIGTFKKWLEDRNVEVVISLDTTVFEWLLALGYRIPRDIGYCNLDCPENNNWSGIDQDPRMIGATALDLLTMHMMARHKGIPTAPQTVLIEGRWREGETLKADIRLPGKISVRAKKVL